MTNTVWIVNHHATLPTDASAGQRHFHLAQELERLGWQVVVFAGSAPHNTDRRRLRGIRLWRTDTVEGVPFRWIRVNRYRGNGIGRILSMAGFVTALLAPGSRHALPRPDVIIGSSVHPLAAWAAARLAGRYRVPFVFEIRDLWPETLIQMGAISRDGRAARLLRSLERRLCDRAALVITTMPLAHRYLEAQGVASEKIVWISNGIDLRSFRAHPVARGEGTTFGYLGAIGHANGLEQIVRGLADFTSQHPTSNVRLRITGEGPKKAELSGLIADLGLQDCVTIDGPFPRDEIDEVAASSDVLVTGLLPLPLYEYGISLNKLFEYMAAGRPILFAGDAAANPVSEANAGVVVPCEPAAISEGIRLLVDMDDEARQELADRGMKHVAEHFSYEALAGRLAMHLTSLLGAVRGRTG